ncbi:hypothetical protein [Carnobacterium maltaromaticum]|uniref:hypothetical protein n=1 Tax=Carnobacterium maltaromaticum TaxID=2751 RepID=UPI000557942F|nr:hypothetical protein [Carnobacterium maltaromaticum]KRN59863.1 hypothetical protein IV70_GL001358 [Carnobacterium maltaromaticum DSM 20342]
MSKLDERLEKLGFQKIVTTSTILANGCVSYKPTPLVYEMALSPVTCLFIEGKKEKGYSTYVFDFYKVSYFTKPNDGKKEGSNIKVYGKNLQPSKLLLDIENYLKQLKR